MLSFPSVETTIVYIKTSSIKSTVSVSDAIY